MHDWYGEVNPPPQIPRLTAKTCDLYLDRPGLSIGYFTTPEPRDGGVGACLYVTQLSVLSMHDYDNFVSWIGNRGIINLLVSSVRSAAFLLTIQVN